MERTDYTVTEERDGMVVEKYLMEYSESDKQKADINQKNSELVLRGKYLVIPMQVFSLLSGNEAIIYSFLNSWESENGKERFYFSNDHLAQRFNLSENTISNIMKGLKNKGLVELKYKKLAAGGRIRFVNIRSTCESRNTKTVFRKTQKLGGIIKTINQEEKNIHSTTLNALTLNYGLGKKEIEERFQFKKPLDRIALVCEAIETISTAAEIEPVFNKDTINLTDIALKMGYTVEQIIQYGEESDSFSNVENYQEFCRDDYYLIHNLELWIVK